MSFIDMHHILIPQKIVDDNGNDDDVDNAD